MPKISLWNENKDRDYYFIDRSVGEILDHGATGVYLHKYLGSGHTGNVTNIQDVLFLENRDRQYSKDIQVMKGHYSPQDSEFNLSQFGFYISNDTLFLSFHYTTMMNILGRKIISGDVIELPHLRDTHPLDEDKGAINKFFVVEDGSFSSQGFGPKWHSHIWRVKMKVITDSPEFADIVGSDDTGTIIDSNGDIVGNTECSGIKCDISTAGKLEEITNAIIAEAEKNVKFDPKYVDASHLWVETLDDGSYMYYIWGGDGMPPNGQPLTGKGDSFPNNLQDGDFYLRTDYNPDRLFKKEGSIFRKIEDDMRFKWTAYNRILDTFIDNVDTDVLQDGSTIKQKQALSKVVKAKANLHNGNTGNNI